MLYLVGMGLKGPESISVEGLKIIKSSDRVFMEHYTSFHSDLSLDDYEKAFGITIEEINRKEIEETETILSLAIKEDVAILVVGDPLNATTHNMLRKDAIEKGIRVKILNSASIITAFPLKCGLSIYKMGPPVSIPFFTDKFRPVSPYKKILSNLRSGFHTLLLLDLNEGKTLRPPDVREILLEMASKLSDYTIGRKTLVITGSRIGSEDEEILFGELDMIEELESRPPMSMIIPAELSDDEKTFLKTFCVPITDENFE